MYPLTWFRVRLSPVAKNIFSDSFYPVPKRKNAYQYIHVAVYDGTTTGAHAFPSCGSFNSFLQTARNILKHGTPTLQEGVSKLKFVMTPSLTSSAMRVVGGRLGLSMLGTASNGMNKADSDALFGMLQKLNVRV